VAAAADVQDGPERLSCPHCLEANDPQAPFCVSCGSPIGDTVTLDPLKQIRAQGWVCLAAVNRPYRLLVLVGLWLLLLPPLAVALALAGTGAAADGGGTAVLLLQLLGGGGATAVILGKATRNYIRLQRA
jgi:hypothetical protein